MTGTCPDLLAALRLRERDLEMELGANRARLEEVREMVAWLETGPKRKPGRQRRPTIVEPPIHTEGAVHQLDLDGDEA
jgi:hypothetical protein